MHPILHLRPIQAPRRKPGDLPLVNPSLRDGLPAAPFTPRGFTLTELLVVVSIVLVLMGLISAAVAGARGSQKKQATALFIAKLDEIITQQYATYASRSVPLTVLTGTNKAAARASYVRRLASADMPDSWLDVKALADGTAGIPRTTRHDAYIAVYQSVNPSNDYSDAECLFMIVMQGGIADCLDCGELRTSNVGDTDKDGAPEFLDAWEEPIRYVLWPAGLELPPGSGRFFSMTPPFSGGAIADSRGGLMRPLIFSGGPDKRNSIKVNGLGNFAAGAQCGDPSAIDFGALDGVDARSDNITNFDEEARRSP